MRVEHIGLATLYLGDCREVLPEIMVTADTAQIVSSLAVMTVAELRQVQEFVNGIRRAAGHNSVIQGPRSGPTGMESSTS